MHSRFVTYLIALVGGALAAAETPSPKPSPEIVELFEKTVRPVLAQRCYSCHGEAQQFSALRLDSRERQLRGGSKGAALVPGDASHSLLIKALRQEGTLKMPPGAKLSDPEIVNIEKWIDAGAYWPSDTAVKKKLGPGDPGYYDQLLKEHWAFQAVARTEPPPVKDLKWSSHPIDRFILAALENKQLRPSPPADRRTLARRLTFLLTGMPPTPLEIDLFVRDQTPGAYEALVDRLLNSPHFGEHWARHWMDVVRFGETFGNDWNYDFPGAWQYRDYLVRAMNNDVPYNQLVREHIAGDLLEKPRTNGETGLNESIIGTAFFRLGEQGHDDCMEFREVRTDVVDNQIDALGKAFLGLTVACARCHDHKLDPIPTADYYSLYGALTSSRLVMRTADLPQVNAAVKRELHDFKPRIRTELASIWVKDADAVPAYLLAADRAWRKVAPSANDTKDLSIDRIQHWLTVLDNKQKRDLSDPAYPWTQISRSGNWKEDWRTLSLQYDAETKSRAAYNREQFIPFGDFRNGRLSGWNTDGTAQLDRASPSGEFAVNPTGSKAVAGVYPAGIYTHTLSERLNASLWSPLVPKDKKFISVQILGGRLGSRRGIIDNCMLSEDYDLLDSDSLVWKKLSSRKDQSSFPFYIELVTKSDNPRFPERPDRLKWPNKDDLSSQFSYFGIARAVLHDVDGTPKDELTHMRPLFEQPPSDRESLAARYAVTLRKAVEAWGADKATDDDARWIEWALENGILSNSTESSPRLSALISDYRLIDSRISQPHVFHSVADVDSGYDVPIFLAGNPRNFGKIVPRGGMLHILEKFETEGPVSGSGRKQIAELIANPENPLTARVMANRIWHYLFQRGIVPTTDNFGRYGEEPSHPELLDHLATRFVQDGWSMKKLIRFIVLSKTFQQSSDTLPNSSTADPENRLLSHFPVWRLEAESIRDAMLATSGRLDRTLGGPSIHPYRTEPKDYRKLFKGPLDGDGRRSIYLKVTRHEGPPFLEIFDFPQPMVPRGNRDNTNVPPQALALLNDPFVLGQAGYWAEQLLKESASTIDERINDMFRVAFGRDATSVEKLRFAGMAAELASLHKVDKDKVLQDKAVWKDIAHTLFLQKEFIYIR